MATTEDRAAKETLTLRLDRKLKEEFASVAAEEDRAASEVLRDLMTDYIDRQRRKQFEAEAGRQSALAAESFDEEEVTRWAEAAGEMKDWTWED